MDLSQLIERVKSLATPTVQQAVAQKVADEALRQIDIGFQTRSDPYGRYWAPRKREYPHPILEKTGALRHSFRITSVTPELVSIRSDSPYGGYHQDGTRYVDIRRMVPIGDRGLGVWGPRIKYLMTDAIVSVIRG